jgi:hypothetical protein
MRRNARRPNLIDPGEKMHEIAMAVCSPTHLERRSIRVSCTAQRLGGIDANQCGDSLIGMQPNARLEEDKDRRGYAVFM